MKSKVNVINFPDRIKQRRDEKAKIYSSIRDEIESVLNKYSKYYNDEWAVVLAAGRYSSMKLQQIEGSDSSIDFFKKCIETNNKVELPYQNLGTSRIFL